MFRDPSVRPLEGVGGDEQVIPPKRRRARPLPLLVFVGPVEGDGKAGVRLSLRTGLAGVAEHRYLDERAGREEPLLPHRGGAGTGGGWDAVAIRRRLG